MGCRLLAMLLGLLVGAPTAVGQSPDREAAVEDFLDTIRMLVYPDGWRMYGGNLARIDFVDDAIVIEARDDGPGAAVIVRAARSMIARLSAEIVEVRTLVGETPFRRLPPDAAVRTRLDTTTVPWTGETMPFGETVRRLRERTHLPILVDWDGLFRRSGVVPGTSVTMPPETTSAGATFEHVLQQLGRDAGEERVQLVVRDGVVRIASVGALGPDRPLVIYDVRAVGLPAEDIADRIRETINPDRWIVNGGDEGMIVELYGRLLIVETAPHHAQIAALLRHLRVEAGVRAIRSPAP